MFCLSHLWPNTHKSDKSGLVTIVHYLRQLTAMVTVKKHMANRERAIKCAIPYSRSEYGINSLSTQFSFYAKSDALGY